MSSEILDRRDIYPTLNPYFTPVEISPNEVQFRAGPWSGPVYDIRDEDEDDQLASVIERFDGNHHIEDIIERVPDIDESDLLGILVSVYEKGIVYLRENGPREETPLFAYLSLHPRLTTDGMDRLRSSAVLVIALGTVGGHLVDDLAALGVEQLGVAGETPGDLPASAEHIDPTTWPTRVGSFDVVVYLEDTPHPRQLVELNDVTHDAGIPWTSGRILGFDGLIGPTIFPGETHCYECFTQRARATIPQPDRYTQFAEAHASEVPTIPAFDHIVSGFLEIEVVNVLTTGFGNTVGNIVHVDFQSMAIESNQVLPLPRCPVCSTANRNDVNRLTSLDRIVSDWQGE